MAMVPKGLRRGDEAVRDDEVVRKNLDLLNEFLLYAFDHPDVLDKIPPSAELVFLPDDDKRLCDVNRRILRKRRKQGRVAVLRVHAGEKPKPIFSFLKAA